MLRSKLHLLLLLTPVFSAAIVAFGDVGQCKSEGDRAVTETGIWKELLFRENGNVKDNWFGYTPLILAALYGEKEEAFELLRHGPDVNARMDWGYTALIIAAGQGQVDIVRALLERGADPNARTDEGRTALDYASTEGFAGVVGLLKAAGAQDSSPGAEPAEESSPAGGLGMPDAMRPMLSRNECAYHNHFIHRKVKPQCLTIQTLSAD